MSSLSTSTNYSQPAMKGPAGTATVSTLLDSTPSARVRTVLVVDDDIGFRRTAAIMLEFHGFKVITACNGLEALEAMANSNGVSAVLLDLLMPVMDGEAAYQHIRQTWNDVPVILTSGFELENAGLRFGARRPDAFLQKPFGFADLAQTLAVVLK